MNSGTAGVNVLSLPGSVNHVGNDDSYDHLINMNSDSLENHILAAGGEDLDPVEMKLKLEDSIYSQTDL